MFKNLTTGMKLQLNVAFILFIASVDWVEDKFTSLKQSRLQYKPTV